MKTFDEVNKEFGHEKLAMVMRLTSHIANSVSINTLLDVVSNLESPDVNPDIFVMPNDEDFFEGYSKTEVAFNVAMGDYNPHDEFALVDTNDTFKTLSESKFHEIIREEGTHITELYLQEFEANKVVLHDEYYEVMSNLASELD
ncbi:TPA_asm: hypothetical protein GZX72_14670 [Listeria monocytogenes]|nr:hypothetical protein [Listeria monocytogenes]